jgi:hypothetical protein
MSNVDHGRKLADKTAGMANEATAKMEHSAKVAQESMSMAAENTSQFGLKVLEIARTNVDSFFDFAQKIMTTKDPSAVMELWTSHTKKQLETYSKQAQELAQFGQKLAGKATDFMPR